MQCISPGPGANPFYGIHPVKGCANINSSYRMNSHIRIPVNEHFHFEKALSPGVNTAGRAECNI